MPDPDRGPYSPPSEPFAFRPREPVRSGPAPVTLIASALVLAAALGAVFLAYRGGVRREGEPPQSVGAPLAQIKTAAPPQADNAATSGLLVERTGATGAAANAVPSFAPPPEAPVPRPPPPPPTLAQRTAPPPVPAAPGPAPARPAGPTIASLADAAERAPRAAERAASDADAPAVGQALVQIGAFSSPTLARAGWQEAARLLPRPMAGRGLEIEPVKRGAETFYRTYVTGFASHAAAEAFCAQLAADARPCFVK